MQNVCAHNKCITCESTIASSKLLLQKTLDYVSVLKSDIQILNQKLSKLQGQVLKTHHIDMYAYEEIDSDYCDPKLLRMSSMNEYIQQMNEKFPLTNQVLELWTTPSHKRKYSSNNVTSNWKLWSDFYRSFICDSFLKSRNPKSVRRTQILIGIHLLLANVPESTWRLLERLRIVTSKEVIEKWVKLNSEITVSDSCALFFSFDNCDFKKHVTHVRKEHRTLMLHIITQYLLQVPVDFEIPSLDIWNDVDRLEFGHWVQSHNDAAISFAESSWKSITLQHNVMPLKFEPFRGNSKVFRADLKILKPLLNCSTLKYEDIERVVSEFFRKFMHGTARTFAFISGDQQVWIKLWYLRTRQPDKYRWLVPIPGEWHWQWHILKGIYKVFGSTILLPLSRTLGYRELDLEAKNFHYAEDFLEIVTIGILNFALPLLEKRSNLTVQQWLHTLKPHSNLYEVIYACFYYFVPYWCTRRMIRYNDHENLEEHWRYWVHLFLATNKRNYSILSIRFLWILKSLNPNVRNLFNLSRVFSFTGKEGTGIALDGLNELVSNEICNCESHSSIYCR